MQKEYIPKKIELYVQEHWKKNKTFQVSEDDTKEKYYCLPMLPYPSGKLHMGHVRNYTISDVIARYQRMLGKNVLQPIGWDAFGLPAEEAAIKNNTIPSDWTYENIKYMKKQLQSLGFSYDWNREITTCAPEYYRWEQWFFTQLYKKKLVYKKNSIVNWCPYDKTVLANEQVIDNCCWRCQSKIIIKTIPQWFIKIRKYAESLYNDLDKLKNWPERVKNMQRNWIGRTKGFEIILKVYDGIQELKVFSPRLDTLMGVTYIIISLEHPLSQEMSKKNKKIKNFIEQTINNNNIPKEALEQIKYAGINTSLFASHPITKKKIPIWISNFIWKEYGTNALLSVPGHNQHDWNFAIKNDLNIHYVIKNSISIEKNFCSLFTLKKGILFNSNEFNNLNSIQSHEAIKKILLKKKIIKKKIHYKLKDWCVSRQRYWGAPIPMATLKNGKIIPIPDHQLPVLLPEIQSSIHNSSQNIHHQSKWTDIYLENQQATRETDTFDTFMESSWYYARYTCPNFHQGMIDPIKSRYWLPVDQYIGGIEHAIMHLMYFRFYHKLLRDFKLVDFDEPVKNLLCQGMVLSEAFYYIGKNAKRFWIPPSSVLTKRNAEGKIIEAKTQKGKKIIYAGMIKMSKSKFNGVEPELIIKRYGADTVRLFIMFAAPVESELEWKESGVKGIHRFLKKIWKLTYNSTYIGHIDKQINFIELNKQQKELYHFLHQTIANVSENMSKRKTFNTAVSEIMKLVNQLIKYPINDIKDPLIIHICLINIIKMLYPFTPHFCFIIWKHLCKDHNIDSEKWPIFEKKILIKEDRVLIIQINGKKKCTINISTKLNKEDVISEIKKQSIIKKNIKNLNFNNIIYIPHKIFNFITSKI